MEDFGFEAGGATAPPPVTSHVDRARRLAPAIAAAADRIETERRLPETVVAALHDAGFYRLLLPRAFGGAEADPLTFAMVTEEIAKADASTAWCLCQASGCSMIAAALQPTAAAEIFSPDARAAIAWGPAQGGQAAPRAVAAPGGYRLTGAWSFASGGRHATWLGGQSAIYEADGTPRRRADGGTVSRTLLFPATDAAMTDIWHVVGLKGTASDAFAVADLFVPERFAAARDDPSERRQQGPLYCFPTNSLYAAGFGGVALGIARSTLDAFLRLCTEKMPRGFKGLLRDNAVIQSQVAQAEARLRAARLLLHATLGEVWREVERTNRLTLDQRMRIRLAATYAIGEATAVVDTAYHAAGATAIFTANEFERRFRDMHTVAQQIQGRQSHFETVGQFLLGLEPDTAFL